MTDPISNQVESWAVEVECDSLPVVIERQREYAVTVDHPPDVLVVAAGDQGPPGPPGPAGGSSVQRIAGVNLSALRIVYELDGKVYPLDYRDSARIDLLLGITTTSAGLAGQTVSVQRTGVVDDSNWNWLTGRVWLGPNGALTQIPPVTGFDLLLGAALSPTRIALNFAAPIALE